MGRNQSGSPTRGPAGHVMGMADMVAYQDGGVVSKTVAKTEGGSVTVFAFDRSQDLSEHTVPYDGLVYLLEGEAEIAISGTSHRLNRGDMIIMPAHQPHAVRAVTRFKMVLTMLRA